MIDPHKLAQMMQQAQTMQADMQTALTSKVVEGKAGGGMVSLKMDGSYTVIALKIEPQVVDPKDIGMLEDLIRAAFNDAVVRIDEFRMEQARSMAGQLGMPPGTF